MYIRKPFLIALVLVASFTLGSLAFAGDRTCEDRTPRLIQLRADNQFSHGANTGVVLPRPRLDVLYGDEACKPDWTAIRKQRIQQLVNEKLDRIHFEFDSAELDGDAETVVAELIHLLHFYQDVGINLTCHTDAMGSEAYNYGLAARRCESVLAALAWRGISTDRLGQVEARGETELLEATSGKSRLNRRVEAQVFDLLTK